MLTADDKTTETQHAGRFYTRPGLAPRRAAVTLVIVTLIVAALGAVSLKVLPEGSFGRAFLNLDGENNLPAVYSGLLLLGAGLIGCSLRRASTSYLLFGVGLVLMGIDEVSQFHERIEGATGIDWEVLYIPIFLAAATILFFVYRSTLRIAPRAVLVLSAGLVFWAVAQVLEALEWDGDVKRPGYVLMMLTEETLEMLGSVAILIALLTIAYRRATTGRRHSPLTR